jgi:hypothetical protein
MCGCSNPKCMNNQQNISANAATQIKPCKFCGQNLAHPGTGDNTANNNPVPTSCLCNHQQNNKRLKKQQQESVGQSEQTKTVMSEDAKKIQQMDLDDLIKYIEKSTQEEKKKNQGAAVK